MPHRQTFEVFRDFRGLAGIIGGFAGATLARKLNKNHIRYGVIVIGFVVSATYFVRVYG